MVFARHVKDAPIESVSELRRDVLKILDEFSDVMLDKMSCLISCLKDFHRLYPSCDRLGS